MKKIEIFRFLRSIQNNHLVDSLFSSLSGLGLGLFGSLLLLDNLLDNLLFLNKESTDDLLLDTVTASSATVSTVNGLLGLGGSGVLTGTESGNTGEGDATFTTLGSGAGLLEVKVTELATRGLNNLDLVRSSVVYMNIKC